MHGQQNIKRGGGGDVTICEMSQILQNTNYYKTVVSDSVSLVFNLLNPAGYVMHQQFNIKQLYALSTLYLCVLYLSENKQRLVPLTS